MAIKVLDYNGLKQLTSKFKDYVNKATSGKANTNDLNRLISNLKVQDTRNANENPSYYIKNKPRDVVKELKILSSIGLNSSSDYGLLITMFPWQDSSIGYPVQMVFILKSDSIYARRGTSDTSWGRWRKVLDDTDLKTKLSQLSDDSTHRLVTDVEKTKWNAKAEKSYVDGAKASVEKNTKTLTDALDKDLKENIARIDAVKADKTDLNNYVKKVSGKGLSTNDFTNAYKSNIDKNLRSDADFFELAMMVYDRNKLFNSKNLHQDLNSFYGTSFSSSIKNLDSLLGSESALKVLINNSKFKEDSKNNLVSSKLILDNKIAADHITSNLDLFKEYLQGMGQSIMFANKFWINNIFKSEELTGELAKKEETVVNFILSCPYVKKLKAIESYSAGSYEYNGKYTLLASMEITSNNYIYYFDRDKNNIDSKILFSKKEGVLKSFSRENKEKIEKKYPIIYNILNCLHYSKNTIITRIRSEYSLDNCLILDINALNEDIAKEA